MHLQPRVFLVYFTVILCTLGLPLNSARSLESSKNDLVRESNSGSGKFTTQCNAASAAECYKTKRNLHSMLLLPKDYQQKLHPKIPLNADLMEILWEYEDDDRSKRFDDYGHMRFGKRGGEQFDDYGHMRFGRSI